jgi:chorismate dehydratase
MSSFRLRFGCHDFLNSRPFTFAFTQGVIEPGFDLHFDAPAALARRLKDGDLDLSLIPSIEYATGDSYRIVKDFAIVSTGRVDSVLLFGKTEMNKMKTVAVDERSRTSSAMLRILFKEKLGFLPEFVTCEANLRKMLEVADGGLLIGDAALQIASKDYRIHARNYLQLSRLARAFPPFTKGGQEYDLGLEWYRLTEKPFVHALLAVRPGIDRNDLRAVLKQLREAKRYGLSKISEIAEQEWERLVLVKERCAEYLTKRIRYEMSDVDAEGLSYFFGMARKHGVLSQPVELKFYETPLEVES